MPRSAQERVIWAKVKAIAYIRDGSGTVTEESREILTPWFLNKAVADGFLDIPLTYGLAPQGEDAQLRVEASTRTLTVIGATSGTTNTTSVAEHARSRGTRPGQGTKRVILFTGRPTSEGSRRKSVIFCRFAACLQAYQIADLLGQAIPTAKIGNPPSATEIYPYFKIAGGLRYDIIPKATADSTQIPQIPTTQADATAMGVATKEGRGRRRAAAGG